MAILRIYVEPFTQPIMACSQYPDRSLDAREAMKFVYDMVGYGLVELSLESYLQEDVRHELLLLIRWLSNNIRAIHKITQTADGFNVYLQFNPVGRREGMAKIAMRSEFDEIVKSCLALLKCCHRLRSDLDACRHYLLRQVMTPEVHAQPAKCNNLFLAARSKLLPPRKDTFFEWQRNYLLRRTPASALVNAILKLTVNNCPYLSGVKMNVIDEVTKQLTSVVDVKKAQALRQGVARMEGIYLREYRMFSALLLYQTLITQAPQAEKAWQYFETKPAVEESSAAVSRPCSCGTNC